MADVKSLLKEARKLIDEKSYKDAQECCKNILRKDKQNYLALVLLGKALQDSDQAPLAYQKAIATKPDLPLAWQGLASYYERKDDNESQNKLIHIYYEVLKLSNEEEKSLEIITKLGKLGCSLKSRDAISVLVNYISSKPDAKIKEVAVGQLLSILKNDVQCKEEDILGLLDIISNSLTSDSNDNQIIHAKIILQKPDFVAALNDVINLIFFPTNVTLREWFCKKLCEFYIQESSFMGFDIEGKLDIIIQGIGNCKYPEILKSMILFDKGLYVEAYKKCIPLVNYQEADKIEATLIIRCAMILKKWSVAQKLATNFLIKVTDPELKSTLKKLLFQSLYQQQKWQQAINVVKEIPIDTLDDDEQAAMAKCCIESNEDADNIVQNLNKTKYFSQLTALSMMKEEKYSEAIYLLECDSSNHPLNLFYLGKCYWFLEEYEQCLISLLKSAKLNTEHADTFLYLGHFYYKIKQDLSKAKKCYEKAYSISGTEEDIVRSLSEIYCKLGLKDLDYELLTTNQESCEAWVNFRLGLHYLSKREWENAILQFRNVIKSDRNHVIAFECLADAYYSRGSYTSALKAYTKVISLQPSRSNHCLTRMGYIHCMLTQYEEAISTFKKVLQLDKDSILALKGIAETWIKVAKKRASNKLFGSARDSAQFAIDYISNALALGKSYTCFWNLMANALILITTLPDRYSYVNITNSMNGEKNITRKEKLDIFPHTLACYSTVAKMKTQICSYDLALTYLLYYHASQSKTHLQISFKLALACINSKPTAWRPWNLLGKICIFMKMYDKAQHCFIKALLMTRKWSVAKIWCNLGTLYVKINCHKLANYCFWRGQSTLPSYPQSWIGQGLIAEVIREEEAMDLYRHASRLGYHPESALGYVDWVCRTLKNNNYHPDSRELKYVIDGLYAITYSIDLMEWFLNYEPHNACALNIIGILQERIGLLQVAYKSYKKAYELCDEEMKNIIRLNIARVLNRLEKYDEAIVAYQSVTEASLDSMCGLALALFKKGQYEESYAAYDTALHWLSNEDKEKSEILVAIAGIVYMFKGIDDSKTILFHSIQVSQNKPIPYSLFAICSLGILHSDQGLSKLALSELQKYEKEDKFAYDIGFLKSYLIFNTNVDLAIKSISDSLHNHPSNGKLWFCMSQYCLEASNNRGKVASCCAQRAMHSVHNSCTQNEMGKMLSTASIAENVSGNKTKSFSLAKQGLHMYPNQSEIWAALIFSLLTQSQTFNQKDWTLASTNYMRKHFNLTRPMTRWISLLEKKLDQ
ncbi:unnamed protein product [Leptosia nina]|uniref:Tetratricopeptide repeat protein 37 n=1 Tax=Leptosia nina TaxID=320188 RepID=A0AAV1J9Y7_9NEOP